MRLGRFRSVSLFAGLTLSLHTALSLSVIPSISFSLCVSLSKPFVYSQFMPKLMITESDNTHTNSLTHNHTQSDFE